MSALPDEPLGLGVPTARSGGADRAPGVGHAQVTSDLGGADVATRRLRDGGDDFDSAVLAALEEGLIVQDSAGAIVMVNEAAAAILGVRPGDLVGRSHSDPSWVAITEDGELLPPEQHLPVVALRTGEAQTARVIGVRVRTGELRWLRIAAVPITDGGRPRGVVTTFTDVTATRAADLALRESEQHFRLAFDNAPIGMYMISLRPESAGQYLRANTAFERMVGYSTAELAGLALDEITVAEDQERDRGLFGQVLSGRADHLSFEKRYVARDGRIVIAWLTTQVARDAHGEPLYLISHAVDITERKAAEAELERLALTDTLTGLANRTLLGDRISHALARLDRDGGHVGLLLLDLDRFKLVNDSLGHQVGDDLLVEVARRLESVSRTDNTVARLGGDEFVVLVEGLGSADQVHAVAGRLLEALREPYRLPTGETLVATASIGVAVAADSARAPSDLFREADLALYRAKDFGRDGYALFDDDLRATTVARVGAERRLRRGLEEGLLRLRYQPIVSLSTGQVIGAEALVRLDDPELGLLTPADFIEVAEETGQIVDVDAVVLEEGVRQLAAWSPLSAHGFRRLAVNVTARSLEQPGFADRLASTLAAHGVDGSLLRVELTERSLLASNPQVRASLHAIAALGVGIGLDDFGTGYSALAYLQRFSLQFLKIDRSFVSRIGRGPREDAIVAAIVDLAHAHALTVIAEGVETVEQLDVLRLMGCDRAQGYYFGKPMPAEDLAAFVRSAPRW